MIPFAVAVAGSSHGTLTILGSSTSSRVSGCRSCKLSESFFCYPNGFTKIHLMTGNKSHSSRKQQFALSNLKLRAKVAEGETSSPVSNVEYPEATGVVIIGAGLAGLAAAKHLAKEGMPFTLLEASDGVGGRVRTDEFEGFLLDRGFQIHITAYPEAQRILDYGKLDLRDFYAGALVWFDGGFHRVADPLRHFTDGLQSLTNPIGSVLDKVLVGIVRIQAALKEVDVILASEETTIFERLSKVGFTDSMVDRFFRPFFGGIFFDRELETTSRLFEFVFRCLALGSNTLPAKGIGAIPQQLASSLPPQSLFLSSKVESLVEEGGVVSGVKLENGRQIRAKHGVIVAVEGPEAKRLLKEKISPTPSITKPPRSTVCLYFSSDKIPFTRDPVLFLNGSKKGIVNNMFFPTNVVPSYGPPGKTLVSVSLIGTHNEKSDADLEAIVRDEMSDWFSRSFVESWKHLRTYRIPFAQPNQTPPTELLKKPRVADGLYVCGDHRNSSTFDGALVSGRVAVETLLAEDHRTCTYRAVRRLPVQIMVKAERTKVSSVDL
ncbi:hypothetical protein R1sor_018420 [Riccia sorocarpa]|uniref:Amine oxidase domain-containing protein n=1 Tax=Riccia sorocarpa TaxID=122646 RepID=A0ABD3I9Q9_9MARC